MTSAHRGWPALVVALVVSFSGAGCSAKRPEPAAATTSATLSTESTSVAPPAALSRADSLRQWETLAREHFMQSGQALQQVSEASAANDAAALGSACKKLHDANTVELQRHLPTPDPQLTEQLQRMIDDINTATHACVRFVLAREDIDAATYRDYLARAVDHLHRAKVILEADLAAK
jgi:hypothetical protein